MKARRAWGRPLAPVYAAALLLKDGLRGLGILPTRRLGWPVVSVGSLSAGGAGKTPVVIALAELLKARGWVVDVLSRGYGRSGSGVERVDPDAADAAGRFGDEPVLIARKVGAPVWVGKERYEAGKASEAIVARERIAGSSASCQNDKQENMQRQERATAGFSAALRNDEQMQVGEVKVRTVHLLDDGFQHRRLARTFDVVLVTAEDLDDALLPAGNRREALTALRRADAVVVRQEEFERIEARVRRLMRANVPLWTLRRTLHFPGPSEVLCAGPRPVAFCGIARPEGFAAMLAQSGCDVVDTVVFGDHHGYRVTDVIRLLEKASECNATGFITTEKDEVKIAELLRGEMLERLRAIGPVCVVRLEARFVDEAVVVRAVEARIS